MKWYNNYHVFDNFSSRNVIRQDATLRTDQVKLPYAALVKCLQQPIINILVRNYNISPSEAYDKWYRAVAKKDERIAEILDNLIHAQPEGLPVLINRNRNGSSWPERVS